MKRVVGLVGLVLAAVWGSCGDDEVKGGDTGTSATDADVGTDTTVTTVPDQIVFDSDGAEATATETSAPTDTTSEPTDTATQPDGQGGCNTFGCACTGNGDCLDGLCIESIDGLVCTRTCVESCPEDFECVQSSMFGDPVSLCVPTFTRLCRPCELDAECQSGADPYPAYCVAADDPADGSFCAASCASRPCPEGYACEDVATLAGGTARQCVPTSGECACRPSWSGLGFVTGCEVKNAFGACDGTRTCGANGLTACTGPQASPELCDGEDNDCNEAVDDIPAVACTVTNAFGGCPGTTACGGNETVCVGKEPAPETCNGVDDNCAGGTDEGSCSDNLTCTTDVCQSGTQCTYTLNAGSCLINGACWTLGAYNPLSACEVCDPGRSTLTWSQAGNTCVIGGACYPNGAVNPQNACQVCNANQSSTAWTTQTNTCQIGGQCYLANDVNPSNPCEICVPTTSTVAWTQAFNTCNIQGQCYAAGAKKPGEPCFVCDPGRSVSGWSAATNGTTCDDGSACSSTSACNGAGVCVGDTSCNDGIACTQDTCTAGGCDNTQVATGYCRINGTCWNQQNQNPANQCQWCSPASSKTAWSNKPSTEGCSDSNACTLNDHCSGSGSCTAGAPKSCADTNQCTADSCNTTTGACINAPQTGTACSDADVCTQSEICSAGTCSSSPVLDQYEANNTISTAKSVASSAICDDGSRGTPAGTFTATLYGPGDEDWFKYRIDDDCSWDSQPAPWVRLVSMPANTNYNLCIYYTCDDWGDGDNGACEGGGGTSSTVSFGGRNIKGCCSQNAGTAGEFGWYYPSCDNGGWGADDDTGTTYIRIWNVSSTWTCSAYSVQFGDE